MLYPILDLKQHGQDLHLYLRDLEQVVIDALFEVSGITAHRIEGLTGAHTVPTCRKRMRAASTTVAGNNSL